MNDNNKVTASALIGAAIGAIVGYLFFTERGRELRADLGSQLEGLGEEGQRLQAAAMRLRDTARDGWAMMARFAGQAAETVASAAADAAGDGDERLH